MTPSQEELDLLRLIALCKDIPVNCGELFEDEMFSKDFIESLEPYIVKSKSKLSYRLSEKGYEFIDKLNVPFFRDSVYVGKGKTMDRRLKTAKVVLTMYKIKVNIFSDEIPLFIPAFNLRRNNPKGIILGASQFIGLIEGEDKESIIFYVDETTKLKPEMEINAAKRFMLVNNIDIKPSICFMNEDKKQADSWAAKNYDDYKMLCNLSEHHYFLRIGDRHANPRTD